MASTLNVKGEATRRNKDFVVALPHYGGPHEKTLDSDHLSRLARASAWLDNFDNFLLDILFRYIEVC